MLLQDGKKKAATLIVAARLDPKKSKAESLEGAKSVTEAASKDGAEADMEPGLMAAAEDLLAAVDAKDPQAIKVALKDFISMCSYEDEEEASVDV